MTGGNRLCALYKELDEHSVSNEVFRATPISSTGEFKVTVPSFGKERFWGLWRTHGMYKYVILRATLKTGERIYKCVSVTPEEPIEMKQVDRDREPHR